MPHERVCTEAATPPHSVVRSVDLPKVGAGVTRLVPEALAARPESERVHRLVLPIGITAPLNSASAAFAHVSAGLPGRAVLLP